MAAGRRSPSNEDWSVAAPLGGGWRVQYHKETGEDFTHFRLVPPPGTCSDDVEMVAPRISAFDAMRVLPWLQSIFKGPEGTRIFRPVVCKEPDALERAQRALRAVDRQATVETDRVPSLPPLRGARGGAGRGPRGGGAPADGAAAGAAGRTRAPRAPRPPKETSEAPKESS